MKKEVVVVKNTIFMFLRMFLVMFLTLFSTRLLLEELGLEKYGIYDLVFGAVLLFNILGGALATALQRFYNISYNNKDKLSIIYSVSLQLFFIISFVVLTFGLIFADIVVNALNIPIYSLIETKFFFQLCSFNLVLVILRLPFTAIIISNERMGLYSLLSILDTIFKFLSVLLLAYLNFSESKLITYGYLINFFGFITTVLYVITCYLKLNMPSIKWNNGKAAYKEILSFSGWTLFGSTASLYSQQGLSILINKFFGVILNAANAVAQQVYTAVYQFVSSFQTAFTPYLMKVYAEGDKRKISKILIFFSRLSVFLYLLIAIPLFIFSKQIIVLWLGQEPQYAVIFVRLTLVIVFFEVLSAPFWITIQASGKIEKYQIIISSILIANLPLAYVFFLIWHNPIWAFLAKILTAFFAYIYRIYMIVKIIELKYKKYIYVVILKILLLLGFMIPIFWYFMSKTIEMSILMLFVKIVFIVLFFSILSYLFLISKDEKKEINIIIFNFINRRRSI
ncbi:hypothetical protein ACT4Y5_05325 [Acinetobacter baumannii]|uniref:hypothetical protein n=1 Tax=Acinetobacter baumannii TaxID=470 RepID=UPI0023401311|nr:hypothetical protein [Acinetobacter baumannii]MDC4836361.1 hypothetical protein [Acinetobacter baumannii]MDK2187085.1 hypothetical protein [Acinetobacter baumannii]MDK2259894.1 hypothetical protein [Acinetobacter baumannii]MDK2267368.1 hypothetical protein [Acinetobacter baumannii]MDK2274669.1 hypothetical protein [Acinetobacter baumannii]